MSNIEKGNFQQSFQTMNTDKTLFLNSDRVPAPNVGAIWTSKNQLQISFLFFTKSHFCIQIKEDKDKYKNPDIKKCEEIQDAKFSPFYKLKNGLVEDVINKNLSQIDEFIFNSNYPYNLIFVLKDKTYLALNVKRYSSKKYSWEIFKESDLTIQNFLDNKENTVFRKRINTILVINLFSRTESYISFFFRENTKTRIISIEWEYFEIVKNSRIPEYIFLTLLLPITLGLDLALLPLTALLWIIVFFSLKK